LFAEKFLRTSTIHPFIFLGRALWADSVSPRMNTIATCDQFKPIRIGENLVVNYKMGQGFWGDSDQYPGYYWENQVAFYLQINASE